MSDEWTLVRHPITDAIIYEVDVSDPEWLTTPIPEEFLPRLRALCELWRGAHPNCRFAMLTLMAEGQYTLRYLPDLPALASAIEHMNHLVARVGATMPWHLEMRAESKVALSVLLRQGDLAGAAPSTH